MNDGLSIDLAARVAAQSASIVAVRIALFVAAVVAGLLWARSLRRTALALLITAAGAGLAFWLVQIRTPFGLGIDEKMGRAWAQAGVDGSTKGDEGFVVGTPAEDSLMARLARVGVSRSIVKAAPQIAAISLLLFSLLAPAIAVRKPGTALFATALTLGGGLWPGLVGFAGALTRPAAIIPALTVGFVLAVLARKKKGGFSLLGLTAGFVFAFAVGGPFATVVGAVVVTLATIRVAPWTRLACRAIATTSAGRRRLEALVIATTFAGGGLLWWNPEQSLKGFAEARNESATLDRPLAWIRTNVGEEQIVVASPTYSLVIAALAQRRVLFAPDSDPTKPDLPEPFRRARLYESTLQGRPVDRLAEGFRATHLLLGPGEQLLSPPAIENDEEARGALILEYRDIEDFRVFRLVRK